MVPKPKVELIFNICPMEYELYCKIPKKVDMLELDSTESVQEN